MIGSRLKWQSDSQVRYVACFSIVCLVIAGIAFAISRWEQQASEWEQARERERAERRHVIVDAPYLRSEEGNTAK